MEISCPKWLLLFTIVLRLLPHALAHMEMKYPFPMRSKFDPQTPNDSIDYDMVAPLLPDGSDYPCKGHNTDGPLRAVATYEAGSSYNMSIVGGAPHMGGSCQLSLSYDNGATFKVIKSMIGDCPLKPEYTFTIPEFAPTGIPLFAWTWFNDVGNREMYMNCAAVTIQGRSPYVFDGGSTSGMNTLPNIYLANIGPKSNCNTVENKPVVFPDPGLDVVYGGGMSASSPASPQDCGGAVESSITTGEPSGANFFVVSTSTAPESWSNGPPLFRDGTSISTAFPPTIKIVPTGAESEDDIDLDPSSMLPFRLHAATLTDLMSSSTRSFGLGTTPFSNLPTAFITIRISSRSGTLTRTSTSQRTITSTSTLTTRRTSRSTYTTTTTTTTSSSSSTSSTLNSRPIPSFAFCQTGQINCTSEIAWSICNSQGIGYIPMGSVSPGTICKDGKIGRAEAYGECTDPVSLRCANNGTAFEVCDQGRWVNMGMVARGTVCRGGMIVPA